MPISIPSTFDVEDDFQRYGLLEVPTSDLADILGVSTSTVSGWVQEGKVEASRLDSLGGGRPGFVFDLESVAEFFAHQDGWKQAQEKYLPLVMAEIERRELDEEKDRQARDAHGSLASAELHTDTPDPGVEDALREMLLNTQDLVVELAVALYRGEDLSTEAQLRILDVVMSRLTVEKRPV